MEIAEGIDLEVRFYHCNARHHTIALARAPFELPQKLHHVMFETNERDDVGAAFDRAWATDLAIPNGLGRHDNDGMFSFYVPDPAGFQVEVGHGARVITDGWNDNRRYDRISALGSPAAALGMTADRPSTPTSPSSATGRSAATLAILLAQLGRSVVVLERWPEPYPLPRAVHFDHEVGRILQSCGIGRGAARRSANRPTSTSGATATGTTLLRFGRVGDGPSGWPLSSMFNQPALEDLLDQRARSRSASTSAAASRSTGLTQDDDGRHRRRRPTGADAAGPLRRRLRRCQQHRPAAVPGARQRPRASSTTGSSST